MVLDAAGVHEETRLRGAPQFCRGANRFFGDSRHLRGAARSPLLNVLRDRLEADGVLFDEVVIDPVVLDHEVEDAVEERDIAARLHRKKHVRGACDRRDARIHHDELSTVLARLPDVVCRDRRALGGVRAGDEHDLSIQDWRVPSSARRC